MRVRNLLRCVATAALVAPVLPAAAQIGIGRAPRESAARTERSTGISNDARTVLGVAVSLSGSDRDTLGVLVVGVTPDGPADRAGIDEGSRLGEINGVSLRLEPTVVARREWGDIVLRRLARELRTVRPGDEVTLRTFRSGRYRTVTVRAAEAPSPVAAAIPAGPDVRRPDVRRPEVTRPEVTRAEVTRPELTRADTEARPATLGGVVDAMGELQAQLRRLAQDAAPGNALGDTLAQAEQDLGDLRRRLRDAEVRQRRPVRRESADDRAARRDDSTAESVPGLRLSPVDDELATYFGEGSERGLLVLQADPSWDPIRTGDVILRVDGAPADADRLRAALDGRRASRIDVLRRRRPLTVTLQPRD